MKTEYYLSLMDIIRSVGTVPIAGYTLPFDDLLWLNLKRITKPELKKLIEFPPIKNQ